MRDIICLVGAGGKTTLMQRLAFESAENKIPAVITTSTHIQRPGTLGMSEWKMISEDDGLLVYEKKGVVLLGRPCGTCRLSSVFAEEYTDDSDMPKTYMDRLLPECSKAGAYFDKAGIIFIEADGSKKRPFKFPRRHEPVIINECTKVIAVMGMDSVGKSLREAGFGYDQTECGMDPAEIILPKMIAAVLTQYDGAYKGVDGRDYTIVLNKCDNSYRKDCAGRIVDAIVSAREQIGTGRKCEVCTAINGIIISRFKLGEN